MEIIMTILDNFKDSMKFVFSSKIMTLGFLTIVVTPYLMPFLHANTPYRGCREEWVFGPLKIGQRLMEQHRYENQRGSEKEMLLKKIDTNKDGIIDRKEKFEFEKRLETLIPVRYVPHPKEETPYDFTYDLKRKMDFGSYDQLKGFWPDRRLETTDLEALSKTYNLDQNP
jgi:hypothetical protein